VTLDSDFEAAAALAKTFTKKPTNEELLELYSLYKQATAGDVAGSQPWAVQMEARAKWDAWAKLKGFSRISRSHSFAQHSYDCRH
jgi:diazepam-binding inhibitor (GABA receptor modulating acyl-CoA-binding protein)